MHYATIKPCDIANGPGVRVSLFVSGCTHHCPGCFNQVAWDFAYGEPFTEQTMKHIYNALSPSYITGLTLLGGEPLEPVNQLSLLPFVTEVRHRFPGKTIWCYTGYIWETDILSPIGRARCAVTDALLSQFDVLVDGPFVQEKYDITLLFRGSANQRLIDLPKTMASGHVVMWTNKE